MYKFYNIQLLLKYTLRIYMNVIYTYNIYIYICYVTLVTETVWASALQVIIRKVNPNKFSHKNKTLSRNIYKSIHQLHTIGSQIVLLSTKSGPPHVIIIIITAIRLDQAYAQNKFNFEISNFTNLICVCCLLTSRDVYEHIIVAVRRIWAAWICFSLPVMPYDRYIRSALYHKPRTLRRTIVIRRREMLMRITCTF